MGRIACLEDVRAGISSNHADFEGGALSSDFGVLLLCGVDQQMGLTERLCAVPMPGGNTSYMSWPRAHCCLSHSVLTGQQRFRSIGGNLSYTLKVKSSQALSVRREAGAKPALPRNCKRNEICEDH